MTQIDSSLTKPWKNHEKILFRFFFIYFFIQAVPLDWKYYQKVFHINWLKLGFDDIFNLTRYTPQFYTDHQSFLNWLVIGVIALIGTVIWSLKDKKDTNYEKLYYWIRVILRYRLAIGVIGYGFIKLFPMQAPEVSISNLNTNYGDFSDWKVFSLSLGIVPNYESFLGFVEILIGALLFHRRTATIGAFIIVVFTGNVFMSNLAYEGGEYVYSFYLITLALFLVWFDALRLYRLIGLEAPTIPNKFQPIFSGQTRKIRLALKSAFIIFFVFIYGFKTYSAHKEGGYQYPLTKGIKGISGIYNVSEFTLNGNLIPYSTTDSLRWNDVVFEKWNTVSIRSLRKVKVSSVTTEEVFKNNQLRNYELSGSAGRHYYSYEVDSTKKSITLANKNEFYKNEKWVLAFNQLNDSTIVLKGINQKNDSVSVVLNKLRKKYLLKEAAKGRRGALTL